MGGSVLHCLAEGINPRMTDSQHLTATSNIAMLSLCLSLGVSYE